MGHVMRMTLTTLIGHPLPSLSPSQNPTILLHPDPPWILLPWTLFILPYSPLHCHLSPPHHLFIYPPSLHPPHPPSLHPPHPPSLHPPHHHHHRPCPLPLRPLRHHLCPYQASNATHRHCLYLLNLLKALACMKRIGSFLSSRKAFNPPSREPTKKSVFEPLETSKPLLMHGQLHFEPLTVWIT